MKPRQESLGQTFVRRPICDRQRLENVHEAHSAVIGVQTAQAGIAEAVENEPARAPRPGLYRLAGGTRSRLGVASDLVERAGERLAHDRGHDVALAEFLNQTPAVSRTHAESGAESRLHLGAAEALDLKPREEAALDLADIAAGGTAGFPEKPLEL